MKQIIVGGYYDLLNVSDTEYNSVAGGITWGTITSRLMCISTPGTFRNLRVELDATPGGGTYTFTLWRAVGTAEGANTSLTCTVVADGTIASDTVNEVAVAPGDIIAIECDPTDSPTARYACWTIEFEGDNAKESLILSNGQANNSATQYYALGRPGQSATEVDLQSVCPTSGKIKNLFAWLSADPGTSPDAYRFTLRIANAANSYVLTSTALTCTITADDRTGSDAVNEITVAAGDILTIMAEPLETPSTISQAAIGMTFVADKNGESIIWGGSNNALHATNTEYNYLTAYFAGTWTATEAQRYQLAQLCTLKKFYVALDGTPGDGKSYTFTVRVEGASPENGLVATVSGTGTTGNDNTHEISIANGDSVNLMVVPDSTPTVREAYWGLVCSTIAVVDYPVSASLSLGLETSISRFITVARAASINLGLSPSASRLITVSRSSANSLGFATLVSRGFSKIASTSLGLAASASRSIAISRLSEITLGLSAGASRAISIIRSASNTLGLEASASRGIAILRTVSTALGLEALASRLANFPRTATVNLGLYTLVSLYEKIKRRVSTIGTNRGVSTIGTNRDISTTGTNRDIEEW